MNSASAYYPLLKGSIEDTKDPAIRVFGHRLRNDQTVNEYLLEFLLVFASEKEWNNAAFAPLTLPHPPAPNEPSDKLTYYPVPHIGLRRLIFYERSKQDGKTIIDDTAYAKLIEALVDKVRSSNKEMEERYVVDVVRDLLYGFSSVLKSRSWYAQSLLPVCQGVLFSGVAHASGRVRKKQDRFMANETTRETADRVGFDFFKRNFLARGGEVYFLHVMQGLLQRPDLHDPIERGLKRLLVSFPQVEAVAQWIEAVWAELLADGSVAEESYRLTAEWIPDDYGVCAVHTCTELDCLLQSELDPLAKMELLSVLMTVQILRMMRIRAQAYIGQTHDDPWLIDLSSGPSNPMRRAAIRAYHRCESTLEFAVAKACDEIYGSQNAPYSGKNIHEHGSRLFRALGKSIDLVVPPTGPSMRFSVSECLVKVLVLSLVPPGSRRLFTRFVEDVHDHYGFIIGRREAASYLDSLPEIAEAAPMLDANERAFSSMLKNCGFLRDLSDATSIVENPFGR